MMNVSVLHLTRLIPHRQSSSFCLSLKDRCIYSALYFPKSLPLVFNVPKWVKYITAPLHCEVHRRKHTRPRWLWLTGVCCVFSEMSSAADLVLSISALCDSQQVVTGAAADHIHIARDLPAVSTVGRKARCSLWSSDKTSSILKHSERPAPRLQSQTNRPGKWFAPYSVLRLLRWCLLLLLLPLLPLARLSSSSLFFLCTCMLPPSGRS